jgi:hypothetical protein
MDQDRFGLLGWLALSVTVLAWTLAGLALLGSMP